ncbi:MAG: AIR synthase-related protein, partial [Sulfitobacter sp.]
ELAETAGIGIEIESDDTATLFGEDQARYLVACTAEAAEALIAAGKEAGVPVAQVGAFGGEKISFGAASALLADLRATYRSTFAQAFA